MTLGIQEIVTLIIVAAVVGFALHRRWRLSKKSNEGCSGCDANEGQASNEKPIRFYRRKS
jgi:hypothetical protein